MPSLKLDHVAIATEDETFSKLLKILGFSCSHEETVSEQKVHTQFYPLSEEKNAPKIELLSPLDPTSAVSRFLKKKGPGIHHLSFRCPKGTLDALLKKLQNSGFECIHSSSKGAQNMRVCFLHPRSTGGVLVELME